MNSTKQNGQFLWFGAVSALLLAAISVFALRAEVPQDAALVACFVDLGLQSIFGLMCLWTLKASGLTGRIETFVDHGSPSLRSLAVIAPWLVVLQIAMGAWLRYKLMGAMSHVAGAMLVGAFLLYFATGVFSAAPGKHAAWLAAQFLLWIVLAQVIFGIAAYVVRFGQGPGSGLPDTRFFSILHIITGALTLGSTIILSHLLKLSATKQEATGLPSTGTV